MDAAELKKLEKELLQHRENLEYLHNSKSILDVKPEVTRLLSDLSANQYSGLLPANSFSIMLNSLLWFCKVEETNAALQQRAKDWAYAQIQNLVRICPNIVYEEEFLTTVSIPQCLIKMVSVIEENLKYNKSRQTYIQDDTVSLLCRMGILAVKQNILPTSALESILVILEDNKKHSYSPSTHLLVSEFLEVVIEETKIDNKLSSSCRVVLLNHHSEAVESEVIFLLSHCLGISTVDDFRVAQSALNSSKLPKVCSSNSSIFHQAMSVMESAWKNSEGHSAVAHLIAQFIIAVNSNCKENSLVSLFSENVQHLVLLFSVLPQSLPCSVQNAHVIHTICTALHSIEQGICNKEEVTWLMVMFPIWYHQLLTLASKEECSDAINLLSLLWSYDVKEEVIPMAYKLCTNEWLSEHAAKC